MYKIVSKLPTICLMANFKLSNQKKQLQDKKNIILDKYFNVFKPGFEQTQSNSAYLLDKFARFTPSPICIYKFPCLNEDKPNYNIVVILKDQDFRNNSLQIRK